MRTLSILLLLTTLTIVCSRTPSWARDGLDEAAYIAQSESNISPHSRFEKLPRALYYWDTVSASSPETLCQDFYTWGGPGRRQQVASLSAFPQPGGRSAVYYEALWAPVVLPGCKVADFGLDSVWIKMYALSRPQDHVWLKGCVGDLFASNRIAYAAETRRDSLEGARPKLKSFP